MITKNAGILRDKDILQEMAYKRLVSVLVSITSFNDELTPRDGTKNNYLETDD